MLFMKKNLPKRSEDGSPCPKFRAFLWAAAILVSLLLVRIARANVYATNIGLRGGGIHVIFVGAPNTNISYFVKKPATAGVVININQGDATVRTINLTNPAPGTAFGPNIVTWDGKDNDTNDVGPGLYTISIIASATGYNEWTAISDDGDLNNYVWAPRGVAVNKNPASLFYGRVFLANGFTGPASSPGDNVGMLKLNADSSPAEEGIGSTGGWNWAGDEQSPWKIEVADDDRVFISDPSAG